MIKIPEKELSDEKIANLSDTGSKHWYSVCSQKWLSVVTIIQEKVKAMQSEIKEDKQGMNSERKEP